MCQVTFDEVVDLKGLYKTKNYRELADVAKEVVEVIKKHELSYAQTELVLGMADVYAKNASLGK